jgi:hypothetical protein
MAYLRGFGEEPMWYGVGVAPAVGLGWGYGISPQRTQRRKENAPQKATGKKERWHKSQRYIFKFCGRKSTGPSALLRAGRSACATRLLGGLGFGLVEG